MNGLVEPVAVPVLSYCARGKVASHMPATITTPETAAIRTATPAISATPIPSRPSMNSPSAHQVPAIAWNIDWNGPTSTDFRKPFVGDPPCNHAFAGGVE